jgi:hypothetical protein
VRRHERGRAREGQQLMVPPITSPTANVSSTSAHAATVDGSRTAVSDQPNPRTAAAASQW